MKKWWLLLGLSILWACDENVIGQEDLEAPEISILRPQSREMHAGDTLTISILVKDNDQLHDIYLGLNDLDLMRKRIHWSQHYHGQSIRLDTSFALDPQRGTGHIELQVEASDHQGNHSEKRLGIFIIGGN